MDTDGFVPRPAEFWSRRAWDRKHAKDEMLTTGPASDVRRICPATGKVIEDIRSEEEPRTNFGRRRRR